MHEAMFYQRMEDGAVVCNLCSHHCHVATGHRGLCGVRENREGRLHSLVYGRLVARQVDPIEKKPLHHYYPGTSVLSFGTAGCNLGCKFCQNWDISKAREFDRLQDEATPEAIAHLKGLDLASSSPTPAIRPWRTPM